MSRRVRIGVVVCGLLAVLSLAAFEVTLADAWAGVALLLVCGVLALATIGALSRPSNRAPFVGFAVFGWGYYTLAHWYTFAEGPLPTVSFLPGAGRIHGSLLALPPTIRIAHDAWALTFAVLGSLLAKHLVREHAAGESNPDRSGPAERDTKRWWRRPVFLGLPGIVLVLVLAATTVPGDADAWAGAAFALSWALMGLAVLGACLSRGRRRHAWIRAASFGVGYLVLAFSAALAWELPTNHLLHALFHPGGPLPAGDVGDDPDATDAESRRIVKALERPVSLHFAAPTTFDVVTAPIRDTIRGPSGQEPVIYGRVQGLFPRPDQLRSLLVTIDCENVPAKDAMRQILKPLGLAYRVKLGSIRIFEDVYRALPFADDPVMIGGHSLLALLAAAMGGVTAPLVARLLGRGQPGSEDGPQPPSAAWPDSRPDRAQ